MVMPKTKRSVVYTMPMNRVQMQGLSPEANTDTLTKEWIQQNIINNMSGLKNMSPESKSNWENSFWDTYNKEKSIQKQISTIDALKSYVSANGLGDLTPWAIDTISKASDANQVRKMSLKIKKTKTGQHDLTDSADQMRAAQNQHKPTTNQVETLAKSQPLEKRSSPETDSTNDAKTENFIKSGLVGSGASAISVSDLNNYFQHANAAAPKV